MSGERALSGLALARRAGKLAMGFDAAMKTARKGDAAFVVLSDALSPKTKKEAHFYCEKYGVVFYEAGFTLEEAERVLGKRAGVFALTDRGFRNLFERLTDDIL